MKNKKELDIDKKIHFFTKEVKKLIEEYDLNQISIDDKVEIQYNILLLLSQKEEEII